MASKFIYAYRDFDGDKQQFSFDVAEGTAIAAWTSLGVELDKWRAGIGAGGGFYDEESIDPGGASANPVAQSANQAILEFQDSVTGAIYTKRYPFPDLTKAADVGTNPAFIVSGGLTVFNPAHADYGTLKAELEAVVISPNGNTMTLNRIYLEE